MRCAVRLPDLRKIEMMKPYWKIPQIRKRCVVALHLFWLIAPSMGATAADVEVAPASESLTLDQLLTLPSAMPIESSQRGGLSRGEWKKRFVDADAEVEAAKADLDASLDKISELVGKTSNWKVGVPGGGQGAPADNNSPVNYGLKQEIKRRREEVARTERGLIDLRVEANLAGVPEDWYKKPSSAE
jgi:hypothetical protein